MKHDPLKSFMRRGLLTQNAVNQAIDQQGKSLPGRRVVESATPASTSIETPATGPATPPVFIVQRKLSGTYIYLKADGHWSLERSDAERFPTYGAAALKKGSQIGKVVSCL